MQTPVNGRPTGAVVVIDGARDMCLEITGQQMMGTEFLHQCTAVISLQVNKAIIQWSRQIQINPNMN